MKTFRAFLSIFLFCLTLLFDEYETKNNYVMDSNAVVGDSISVPSPREVLDWPSAKMPHLGQVSGVTINNVGQPVIFHRGPRIWNARSFNSTYNFQMENEGPIDIDTVLTLDPKTGSVLTSWGAGMFYLPHGITIDYEGNVWLTDVALHQVFKYAPGSSRPSMTFGEKFQPGSGTQRFCMPTSVAVADVTGDVFIADGYCNSRVMKYNFRGELTRIFPQTWEFLNLQIPHSIALMEKYDLLCIADRENMRVTCIGAEMSRNPHSATFNIQEPDLGRVFAIATYGDFIYAVNGPTSKQIPIQGFTLHPFSEMIVDHWDSFSKKIWMPHDMAITKDGKELYLASVSPNKILKFQLNA